MIYTPASILAFEPAHGGADSSLLQKQYIEKRRGAMGEQPRRLLLDRWQPAAYCSLSEPPPPPQWLTLPLPNLWPNLSVRL
ncbi:unnamed protein product [Caenorhabditis auriculariae]|uniref:Uncharacterized protein n=1 Tax=Caenorhabditis auriculariae TaxID=2777116 RepID=A0A8S1HZN5_9PELO|nr:unnamed protein product [Caenorhabditis auriculariae]